MANGKAVKFGGKGQSGPGVLFCFVCLFSLIVLFLNNNLML